MSRLMFVVLMLMMLAAPAAAQAVSPRAAPPNDSFENRSVINWGYDLDDVHIEEATLQADEPTPSCAGPVNDRSVWYQITVPAGKLKIYIQEITASLYMYDDKLMVTLYEYSESITELNELACAIETDTDSHLWSFPLKKVTAAGTYIVRIANVDDTPSDDISFNFYTTVKPPRGIVAPPNDRTMNQKYDVIYRKYWWVIFNKTMNTPHLEYARSLASDVASCGASTFANTLWYKFILYAPSRVTISTEGSALGYTPLEYRTNTMLRLLRRSDIDTEIACNIGDGVSGAARLDLTLDSGTYHIQLGQPSTPLTAPSNAVLRVTVGELPVLDNGGFEYNVYNWTSKNGWTLKNATRDELVTGAEAITGSRSFRFTGGPGENSKLRQNIPLPNIRTQPNSLLKWQASIKCDAVLEKDMTVRIKAIYADGGTETTSFPLQSPTSTGLLVTNTTTILLKRAKAVSLQVTIKNKAAFGDCLLDDIQLNVISTYGARDVLPLPPPAQ